VEIEREVFPVPCPGPGKHDFISGDARFHGLSFAGKKGDSVSALITARDSRFPVAFLLRHRGTEKPETDPSPLLPDQVEFVDRVLRRAGLNPRHYRRAPLLRRIPACLRALKVDSLPAALAAIEGSPERLLISLNALLIGTTSFFRDRPVFDELQHHIIPALLRRGTRPRVWSAACSDGAELYSVAMMFERHGEGTPLFLGTDCRAAAVARAKEGIFPLTTTGDMPATFTREYVHFSGNTAKVDDRIREQVIWDEADIMTRPIASRWDLILCRNLAIYLEPGPLGHLWKKLSAAVVPGGYLVVGRAEKPRLEGFSCVAPCIYQKHPLPSIS
jgi:chemotaxis protein methyltransferase CheR